MGKKSVQTEKAPQAIGPYSQGIKVGNTVYVSGQIAVDPATGQIVSGGAREQTKQCMENILAVLAAEGMTAEDIVKTTIYLKDLNNFDAVNEVYSSFFAKDYPARVCLQVARLPKDVEVEIEAIAVK
ncbi:MAG: RidA family protein [Clostridia bacterium]|nr:RidA family protein [Clostridia bacterium]